MLGNLSEARSLAEKAMQANPDAVNNKLALAAVMSEQLVYSRSEELFKSAMRASSNSSLAGRSFASALIRRNKITDAEKILKETLIKQGKDGPTMALFSELEWEKGNFEYAAELRIEAERLYREAGNSIRADEMLAWLNIEALPTLKKIQEPRKKPQPKMEAEPIAIPTDKATPTMEAEPKPKAVPKPKITVEIAGTPLPPRQAFGPRAEPEGIMIDEDKEVFTGSGVVLKGGDWVLTNKHVVENTEYLIVRNGLGEVRNVKEVFLAENDDLAILVLDEPYPKGYSLSVKDFVTAETGSEVFVMGYPMSSIFGTFHPTITAGIVSNPLGFGGMEGEFQMTAKINPGNSGGPIFNKNGQIVGIATGKLNKTQILEEDGFIPEDISFGVTSQRALEFINRPISGVASEPYQYSTEQLYKYMRSAIVFIVGQ
jgi:S1-C subfamily serine protease